MRSELLVNEGIRETRVALIENGQLQEVHVERNQHRGRVGNIYKGRVVRVLPGMQAAFVDIGLERAGFLHVIEAMPMRRDDNVPFDLNAPEADVRRWLYEGQELLVQVIKDQMGHKGARLTAHLSIAARYLVYMPDLHHIGVSLKLESEAERDRLQKLVANVLGVAEPTGYIIRTVAQGIANELLARDIHFLDKLWRSIGEAAKSTKAPGLVYEDLPVLKRLLRDLDANHVERILIDTEKAFLNIQEFVQTFVPEVQGKLERYLGGTPILDMYGVEIELEKALGRTVQLKSGGYLVIDHTEAMTTIDVNTGAFVGTRNLEETIFKTNLEAAQAIARELRLRNIGGIVIIDFIDMTDLEHREQVYSTFSQALVRDSARICLSGFTELGLLQLTRKRMRESLSQTLCEVCPQCQGRGKVKTVETVAYEIFREIRREAIMYPNASGFVVVASPLVIDYLHDTESEGLADLESQLRKTIKMQVDTNFTQEHYDLVLL
ncbi:MAG: ribonuclease G [Gammaproteobacteria bacterium]|nr:ribonuclease G [Gammaproteobacteria bacterium]